MFEQSPWLMKNGTLSHKNACKEFGFTEKEIFDAMKTGKIQYRQNYAHGNPYFRVLRKEVETLAKELNGNKAVVEQELKFRLQKINREINSHKRELASLEKQKAEVLEIQKKIKT